MKIKVNNNEVNIEEAVKEMANDHDIKLNNEQVYKIAKAVCDAIEYNCIHDELEYFVCKEGLK